MSQNNSRTTDGPANNQRDSTTTMSDSTQFAEEPTEEYLNTRELDGISTRDVAEGSRIHVSLPAFVRDETGTDVRALRNARVTRVTAGRHVMDRETGEYEYDEGLAADFSFECDGWKGTVYCDRADWKLSITPPSGDYVPDCSTSGIYEAEAPEIVTDGGATLRICLACGHDHGADVDPERVECAECGAGGEPAGTELDADDVDDDVPHSDVQTVDRGSAYVVTDVHESHHWKRGHVVQLVTDAGKTYVVRRLTDQDDWQHERTVDDATGEDLDNKGSLPKNAERVLDARFSDSARRDDDEIAADAGDSDPDGLMDRDPETVDSGASSEVFDRVAQQNAGAFERLKSEGWTAVDRSPGRTPRERREAARTTLVAMERRREGSTERRVADGLAWLAENGRSSAQKRLVTDGGVTTDPGEESHSDDDSGPSADAGGSADPRFAYAAEPSASTYAGRFRRARAALVELMDRVDDHEGESEDYPGRWDWFLHYSSTDGVALASVIDDFVELGCRVELDSDGHIRVHEPGSRFYDTGPTGKVANFGYDR